jgi:hypothetical protein
MKHQLVQMLLPEGVMEKLTGLPRPILRFVSKQLKGSLVCAEIGVAWGMNTRSILETLDVERLFLVDPYET